VTFKYKYVKLSFFQLIIFFKTLHRHSIIKHDGNSNDGTFSTEAITWRY